MKLGTIAEEVRACRKAFKGFELGGFVLHCHHDIPIEQLTAPAWDRISYILRNKSHEQRALRLRLFRPLSSEQEDLCLKVLRSAIDAYVEAIRQGPAHEYPETCVRAAADYSRTLIPIHALVCISDCPWDGKTIFSKVMP
jgi:hypothetical protein